MAEREMARNAARISALTEAKTRLHRRPRRSQSRRRCAESGARRACRRRPSLEASLPTSATEIEGKRAELAEVRAEAQALAREAEMADRRLNAIGTDRSAWSERRDRANAQIATLDTRSAEAKARARVARRRAGDLRGEAPRADRRNRRRRNRRAPRAADRLAEAENALAAADRAVRAALEALGAAREEAARADERVEGAKRRLTDIAHEIREMLEVRARRARGSCRDRAGR